MSETNQNELQLRIMYPLKCGYCYYRFFISTNAMSIIVITPGYNLIPINNFATSFFLCKTLSIKYSFIEMYCRININGIQRLTIERAKEYHFSLQWILILTQNTLKIAFWRLSLMLSIGIAGPHACLQNGFWNETFNWCVAMVTDIKLDILRLKLLDNLSDIFIFKGQEINAKIKQLIFGSRTFSISIWILIFCANDIDYNNCFRTLNFVSHQQFDKNH